MPSKDAARSDALIVARAVRGDEQATAALRRLIVRLNVRNRRAKDAERRLNLARVRLVGFVERIDEAVAGEDGGESERSGMTVKGVVE